MFYYRVKKYIGAYLAILGGADTVVFGGDIGENAPDLFTLEEATHLLERGALRLNWAGHKLRQKKMILTVIGSYQLEEVLKASLRQAGRDIPHSVVYMQEPGKFRAPRSNGERIWAHILGESAGLLSLPREKLLTAEELDALDGRASPEGVIL